MRVLAAGRLSGELTATATGAAVPLAGEFTAQQIDLADKTWRLLRDTARHLHLDALTKAVSVRFSLTFDDVAMKFTAVGLPKVGLQVTDLTGGARTVDCPDLLHHVAQLTTDVYEGRARLGQQLDDPAKKHAPDEVMQVLLAICRLWLSIGDGTRACNALVRGARDHGVRLSPEAGDDPEFRELAESLRGWLTAKGQTESLGDLNRLLD